MRRSIFPVAIASIVGLCMLLLPATGRSETLNAEKIGQILGTKATLTPDGVVRVGWARNDVAVKVDRFAMQPFLGLGTWAAIKGDRNTAMLMGDTVVFEDEVNPAIDAAFAAGLTITGLHNHFFYDQPRVYFMHIGGMGPPEKLAAGVRQVWDAIKRVRKEVPVPATQFSGDIPTSGPLDAAALSQIVGAKGELHDGLLKITLGRAAEMHGESFGGSMGLTTWCAFAGSDHLALVDGDFAMTGDEVTPVLKALRTNHINIVALHNHMIGEKPAIYFTHFWGKGKAADLARGIRQALDAQKAAHS